MSREENRSIAVVGHGEVTVEPDLALLSLAVETTATTAGAANSGNATKAAAVVEAVKKLLDDEDSLKTTGYSLQPRYADRKPGGHGAPEITGYIAQNEVQVCIHRLESVGLVLDAALQAGANRASNLHFTIEDRLPHRHAALARAGAEAQAQAESIAAALGVQLGPVLSASTESRGPSPRRGEVAMMRTAAATTPVEAGDVKVGAVLHVTYGIREES